MPWHNGLKNIPTFFIPLNRMNYVLLHRYLLYPIFNPLYGNKSSYKESR